jgi:CheY-like chemotaxis protein
MPAPPVGCISLCKKKGKFCLDLQDERLVILLGKIRRGMRKQGPIVIVDDDADDQYLYQRTLERFELKNELIFFDNGQQALDYLNESTADPFMILCDINMPVMDGLQLRERMCQTPDLCKKNTPFIFMSTSLRPSDIEKACSLFTQGFFQKESSYEKHEAVLKNIIDYWENCRYAEHGAA